MQDLYSIKMGDFNNTQDSEVNSLVDSLQNLIDKIIFCKDGKQVGKIVEIFFQISSGQINYVIVDCIKNQQTVGKLIALPWDILVYDQEKDIFVANVDDVKLDCAPSFTQDKWPDMTDEKWADSIHSFYGTHMKRSSSIHSGM